MGRLLQLVLTTIIIITINFVNIHSRKFRVAQLPNGSVNSCANCHVSPQGGGQFTAFGRTVSDDFLDFNGNVMWDASLASRDSDGDGFTNGRELLDPDGKWTFGQPDPGDPANVYNPGDAGSKPIIDFISTDNYLSSVSMSPNPFSDNIVIRYSLEQSAVVSVYIFNLNGEIVKTVPENYFPAGSHEFNWNGKDDSGIDIPAGQYSAVLLFEGAAIVRKISYVK